MKLRISVILTSVIFAFYFSGCPSFAEDSTEDWGSLLKNHDDLNNFGKIISEKDYQKAIETKESYIKKSQKKKKKPEDESENNTEPKAVFELPESPNPLLVLPTDVYYENMLIKQGFYLVNLKCDGGKYFLELRQGNLSPVAVIETKKYSAPVRNILKPQVSVKDVDDKMIKINYSGDNLILESVLWKY